LIGYAQGSPKSTCTSKAESRKFEQIFLGDAIAIHDHAEILATRRARLANHGGGHETTDNANKEATAKNPKR
jgi:hypothetical protein